MDSASTSSPGVHSPASDTLVVSAICCATRAVPMDRPKTTMPTAMSARFGSFRSASRKTDDTA